MNNLASYVDTSLSIEKLRVASQIRQTHLTKQNKHDKNTDEIVIKLIELEDFINDIIANNLESHPAYWWFSHVKGVGRENIGKVVGFIRIKPEKGTDKEGNEKDLPYADTISSAWKFCGYALDENGNTQKRTKGEKLDYCAPLRSMLYRLGTSLLRAKGKFYDFYNDKKAQYERRYIEQGWKIVPATQLTIKNGKKVEVHGIISEGHIHSLAFRKMMKLFVALLWLAWRKGEGLPETEPYAEAILKHQHIFKPEEFMDKNMNS